MRRRAFVGAGLSLAGAATASSAPPDGKVRVVNHDQEPDLLWSLKGGGGGTFGVVTRLTR